MINIFKLSTIELEALSTYRDVLETGSNFPKNFWVQEKDTNGIKTRCSIITRYCLETLEGLSPNDLPTLNLKQIKEKLVNWRLSGMIQLNFNNDILAILKNAYPNEFRDRILTEWMWSKHGLWENDNYIIEAVKVMVKREGITHVRDIPLLDWKKRLQKHGIYNVLSRFNWSIYELFNFVYPGKFHPADFRYKVKWSSDQSLENAFYYMHKIFKNKNLELDDILLLNTSAFRKLGLAAMLVTVFESSTFKAKEYYLYRTIGDKENRKELQNEIKAAKKRHFDENMIKRLSKVAQGKFIYNLHSNNVLYGYVKRHAKLRNMSIEEFIASYGFIYKSAAQDKKNISRETLWELRKKGMTYVEIAKELDSNPTTISQLCDRYFGGDPLIPRPISDYITVQEVMNKYHVDHKTVMKVVLENGFENHTTIRFRYLNKHEIEPAMEKYIQESKHHKFMVKRYAK
ncbi:MAG TPA: helix-turn-helix domain-containing protein [Clostridiaceae bacterium]|nr:helix-turn-helix domain-containing protein [Clostridiaceae bacterium]